MAKAQSVYICQSCGTTYSKWAGKCEACGAWNSMTEEIANDTIPKGLKPQHKAKTIPFVGLKRDETAPIPRRITHIGEFDRVTGGGLVKGSALLIGGDPGIGKSTLLLQVVAALAQNAKCAYISGEESVDQVRLRAARLGFENRTVDLASTTNVRDIISAIDQGGYDVVVIDSIQTMYIDNLESAPGTVSQVRASAAELIRITKKRGTTLFLVGHVTKDGQIAGPRVLEHMVDCVLYFEGDRGHQFRILRTVKNRFGATDEIGVFEMASEGLCEVLNPSALFLSERQENTSGSCVFAGMEGTRPLLVEIQALVAPSPLGTPRRAVIGWDQGRLAIVLAVLEARCGVKIGMNDIYLNIAGGLKVTEPAADLAVALALISALSGVPVPHDMVAFGEIGLSGEVRSVGQSETRLKEASKLGFHQALTPKPKRSADKTSHGLTLTTIGQLKDILPLFTDGENS
jgi:DNA repair protein RadA/Sms